MALPVSFRWDEEFVASIDRARGDVPRSVWVRRAVERALLVPTVERVEFGAERPMADESPGEHGWEPLVAKSEQPRHGRIGPKRSFTPVPKRGK